MDDIQRIIASAAHTIGEEPDSLTEAIGAHERWPAVRDALYDALSRDRAFIAQSRDITVEQLRCHLLMAWNDSVDSLDDDDDSVPADLTRLLATLDFSDWTGSAEEWLTHAEGVCQEITALLS
jgi:hypothetical protein